MGLWRAFPIKFLSLIFVAILISGIVKSTKIDDDEALTTTLTSLTEITNDQVNDQLETTTSLSVNENMLEEIEVEILPDEESVDYPEISLETKGNDQIGFSYTVKCQGQNLTSLTMVQCKDQTECSEFLNCIQVNDEKGQNCSEFKDDMKIQKGSICLESDDEDTEERAEKSNEDQNCLKLIINHKGNQAPLSSLIECTSHESEGSQGQREIDYLLQDANFKGRLLSDEEGRWIRTRVLYENEILHPKGPLETPIYINQQLYVECAAAKIPTEGPIKISLIFKNGAKIDLSQDLMDVSVVDEFVFAKSKIGAIKVVEKMVGISCSRQFHNGSGWSQEVFKFDARVPMSPIINKGNDQKKVFLKGGKGELNCTARGKPLPQIEWHQHGNESGSWNLDTNLITNTIDNENVESIIIFKNLTQDAQGTYTCLAWSTVGNDSLNFDLTVSPNPSQLTLTSGSNSLSYFKIFTILILQVVIFIQ